VPGFVTYSTEKKKYDFCFHGAVSLVSNLLKSMNQSETHYWNKINDEKFLSFKKIACSQIECMN
jgi:hypothetical protein